MYLDGNVALPGASRIFLSLFLSITLLSFLLSLLGHRRSNLSLLPLPTSLTLPSLPRFPPFLSSCNAFRFYIYIFFFCFLSFFHRDCFSFTLKNIKSSMNHFFSFLFDHRKNQLLFFFHVFLFLSSFFFFFIFLRASADWKYSFFLVFRILSTFCSGMCTFYSLRFNDLRVKTRNNNVCLNRWIKYRETLLACFRIQNTTFRQILVYR